MEVLIERSAPVGGVSAPPITLEPGARVYQPTPCEEIVLVGMGMSSIQLMSDVYGNMYREKGKREVWVINAGAFLFQHDLVFNMRDLTASSEAGPGISYLDLYRDHPQPVITTRYIKEIKNCYEFPWELLFNSLNDYYFASSPAYMVALAMINLKLGEAITGKPGTLRLYGLDFNYPGKTEYESGRCCVEYWVGRAKQAGITVLLPEITSLCDQSLRSMGPGTGLQGNGFCYGMHHSTPVFGVEKGRLFLKAFKDRREIAATDDPGQVFLAPREDELNNIDKKLPAGGGEGTDDPAFPPPERKIQLLQAQLEIQHAMRNAAVKPNGEIHDVR
jgi:hypothetical protein